jgi:hypothetical protein
VATIGPVAAIVGIVSTAEILRTPQPMLRMLLMFSQTPISPQP